MVIPVWFILILYKSRKYNVHTALQYSRCLHTLHKNKFCLCLYSCYWFRHVEVLVFSCLSHKGIRIACYALCHGYLAPELPPSCHFPYFSSFSISWGFPSTPCLLLYAPTLGDEIADQLAVPGELTDQSTWVAWCCSRDCRKMKVRQGAKPCRRVPMCTVQRGGGRAECLLWGAA